MNIELVSVPPSGAVSNYAQYQVDLSREKSIVVRCGCGAEAYPEFTANGSVDLETPCKCEARFVTVTYRSHGTPTRKVEKKPSSPKQNYLNLRNRGKKW